MRSLFVSSILFSTVISSLPCPSGKVAIPSPNNSYLECTNSTNIELCGSIGSCEIVSNPHASKMQKICCIASSLLCADGQFMLGGRCYEERDLPSGGNGGEKQGQIVLQQFTTCPLGKVNVQGQCLSLAAPGSVCTSSQQCIDSSTCNNQRCTCSTFNAQIINNFCIVPSTSCSKTQTRVNGQCVTYATVGSQCVGTGQCVGGSTCVNQMCTCLSGTTEMFNYCISSFSNPSDPCPTGQALVNGQCVSLAFPGSFCQATSQCLDSSSCSNSVCTCSNRGSVLDSGYCVTPVNGCYTTQTQVNGRCVSLATPGHQCQATQQCVGGATCINQVCTCPSGSTHMNGYCVPIGARGTRGCTNGQISQQCIGGGQCLNSVCQKGVSCRSEQVAVNGQCLNMVQPGGFCQVSQQCANNGQCLYGICQTFSRNGQYSKFAQFLKDYEAAQQAPELYK